MLAAILKINNDHPELMHKVAGLLGSTVTLTQTDKDIVKELHTLLFLYFASWFLTFFSVVPKRLAGESISEMTYFVSSRIHNRFE